MIQLSFRESQVLGFQMQAELESVKAELETQRRETEQLQQALQDSINQLQRNQQESSVTNRNNRVSHIQAHVESEKVWLTPTLW